MNDLERKSATYYNKVKREKERYYEKLRQLKVKNWQKLNYRETELKRREELTNRDNSLRSQRVQRVAAQDDTFSASLRTFLQDGASKDEEEKKKRVQKEEKKNRSLPSSELVSYQKERKLDPVHQQMLYIQYLLNTFEMYPEFNIHYYRNNNDDIKHLSNYELVYHWNHYGVKEKSTRIYNQDTFMEKNPQFYKENPIYIFMHVCNLHNGVQIFYEQLQSIVECGLYEKCKNILVCIVGKSFEIPKSQYPKLLLLYQDDNPKYYEVKTINYLKYIVERINPNSRILYIHTKGVRKNGDEVCVRSWRKLLEHWTIVNHEISLQYLIHYDTVGSNVINMSPSTDSSKAYLFAVSPNHFFHYSGNFWWARADHIRKLPLLNHDPNKDAISTRCRAENWILSPLPHMRGFEIYYNKSYVHPYHIYCDPKSYQKPYMEVFTGRNNFSVLQSS